MASDADIRADIPTLLSVSEQQRNKQLHQPQYRQRWGRRDDQEPKASPDEIVEFVRTYAWPKETELALQSLFEGDYDVSKAVEIMHDARREKVRLKREETERILQFTFEKALERHGKKFHLVKRRLGRAVTTQELVSKFYLWKKTPEYEKWHDGQREKKRKREAKRIAQQIPAADQHMEYCEMCLKGGKLLCCDSCERAYHLNCVRPALLDVPEGDWFCSHCREATAKASPAKTREKASVSSKDILKSTSKPKTRPNGTSLKGSSDVQPASHVHDIVDMKVKSLVTNGKKNSAKSKPTASSESEAILDHPSPVEASPTDGISDITTESESDGGAAKVFQSLSTATRKRKQRTETIEAAVGMSRYSSPSRSLEYLTSSLQADRRNVRREVMPLQLEFASSARKRNRRYRAERDIPHSLAMGV